MLINLQIKNLILVEKAEMEFGENFNVITGETGSGKSILLDCLSYCFGEKNTNVEVRKGEEKGGVTTSFDISSNDKVKEILNEIEAEIDDELVIRRTLNSSGKSQIYVNDVAVSANIVKRISKELIEIYGQSESSNLTDRNYHLQILDEFADSEKELKQVGQNFAELKNVKSQLEDFLVKAKDAATQEEFIQHAFKEISAFNLQENEEHILSEKRILLQSSGKIREAISSSYNEITSTNAVQAIYSAQKKLLKQISAIESDGLKNKLQEIHESLERAAIEINESVEKLEEMAGEENSADELERLEDRLFAIRDLTRKYRRNANELIEYQKELEQKLSLITSFDKNISDLQKRIEKLKEEFLTSAKKLSLSRKKAAEKLEKLVNSRLPELKMEGARFKVSMEEKGEDIWNGDGIDKVTFTAATNPGQPFSDIGKTASGGELSRLMLSLKLALTKDKNNLSVIFDEIDTGIGGATADAVGLTLAQLGKKMQVIAITHQPQVASKADVHFTVEKKTTKNTVSVAVTKLSKQQANEEIARMISGESITEEARAAAKKLKA